MRDKLLYPVLLLSIPLVAGIVLTSSVGLFTEDFYSRETPNWELQSWVQDMVNLFLVTPLLCVSALMAFKGNKTSFVIWAGTIVYLIYTFVIYSFDIHFNSLFLFYCLNLGLAFYSILFFVSSMKKSALKEYSNAHAGKKIISIFFITIALFFYALWLMEIIPAVESGTIPSSLSDVGLTTNPVQVIDLAIFLPGVFITGILLWRNKYTGLVLTPVILTFFVLMNITIGLINLFMFRSQLSESMMLTWIMGVLALSSFLALIWFITEFKNEKDFSFDYQV
jgi:hypothetical protein